MSTNGASRTAALNLYRSILRAHANHLPPNMRGLGDTYVKNEFRLHKATTNTEQLAQFYTEWQKYLDHLQSTARARETVKSGVLDDGSNNASNVGGGMDSPGVVVTSTEAAVGGNKGTQGQTVFAFGTDMPKEVQLSEEQLVQLRKLREEAQKAK
uniref:Succinate dehydrogenase assembly factor 3 n=1 Tax=Minutocellus polymorphus TaxID=265543 RepID=A0A7S0AQM6_9STRA